MDLIMPLGRADTKTSGFFCTEGAYTSLGKPIPGGQVGRWLLRKGSHIESIVEMFDELCWRLVGIFQVSTRPRPSWAAARLVRAHSQAAGAPR